MNTLLIFEIHHITGTLFSYAIFLSALSFSFAVAAKRSIVPYTTINALILSHTADLKIEVLNLTMSFIRLAVFCVHEYCLHTYILTIISFYLFVCLFVCFLLYSQLKIHYFLSQVQFHTSNSHRSIFRLIKIKIKNDFRSLVTMIFCSIIIKTC